MRISASVSRFRLASRHLTIDYDITEIIGCLVKKCYRLVGANHNSGPERQVYRHPRFTDLNIYLRLKLNAECISICCNARRRAAITS